MSAFLTPIAVAQGPAGVLVAGTVTINYSVSAPLMAVLTTAALIVFLMMRTHLGAISGRLSH